MFALSVKSICVHVFATCAIACCTGADRALSSDGPGTEPTTIAQNDGRATQEYQARGATTKRQKDDRANQDAMQNCMGTWDAGTGMSMSEWRSSCRRMVKEYPELYDKAF